MDDTRILKPESGSKTLILEAVKTLVAVIEKKDPALEAHCKRVADNCANFCEQYEIVKQQDIENIYFAGLLHDIGIVSIPLEILQKTEDLTDAEMVLIRRHPVTGEKILGHFSGFKPILPIVRHHHEAYDGSGYPDGLEGDKIPLGARIVGLFNQFDNLVFSRFPDQAMSSAQALKEITKQADKMFDRSLLQPFTKFIESTDGKSEDFLRKQAAAASLKAFSEILQKFKTGKFNFPVFPQVIKEFLTAIKRPASTADGLAAIIKKDAGISLRLIAIANSPVYRGIQKIPNVKNALSRLGDKETVNILIAIANKNLYETDKAQFKILMNKLWTHSLASAFGAKLIAQKLKFTDPEKFFLMGLTHDIGKALLLSSFAEIEPDTSNMDTIMAHIEEAHIGTGRLLLKRWDFDDQFINVVSHHEGTAFSSDTKRDILIVNLANMLTRKIGFSLYEDEIDFAELESAQLLKIKPDLIDQLGQEIKQIIADVAHLY